MKRENSKRTSEVKIGTSNVKERVSRNKFELCLSPWVCNAMNSDHGYDYNIEIASGSASDDYIPDGIFFNVQLKAQSKPKYVSDFILPHPVETKKIKQWYNGSSQVPALFVVHDLGSEAFYYQWIDDEFITALEARQPLWTQREKFRSIFH